MMVSDSADPLFIKEFLSRKQLFNTRALDHYIKRKALKNVVLIIPIIISFTPDGCIRAALLSKMMLFNNQPFDGRYYLLPAINDIFVTKSDY